MKFKSTIILREIRNLKREVKKSILIRKRIYTLKEASTVIGVSESYLQKMVSSKLIPYSKPTGKLIFIKRRDLEKFLMKNYVQSIDEVDTIVANTIINIKSKL